MAATLEISSVAPRANAFSNANAHLFCTGVPSQREYTSADEVAHAQMFLDVVLAARFAGHLPRHTSLEQVRWKVQDGQLHVWTVISERNEELQRQIYAAEMHLLDADVPVDFSVVCRNGRPVDGLFPADAFLLNR